MAVSRLADLTGWEGSLQADDTDDGNVLNEPVQYGSQWPHVAMESLKCD